VEAIEIMVGTASASNWSFKLTKVGEFVGYNFDYRNAGGYGWQS